jgi:hypothetical protein
VHQIAEKIFYLPGQRKEILIAAPHHGYTRGCDYYTREAAALLAAQLNASLLFAEGLRPLVDLNKDPELASTPYLKQLCQIYQKQAFSEQVELFLEIHGHVNGYYDLEISCGFEFDPLFPLDKEFAEKLAVFHSSLVQEISSEWQGELPPPSIGVFPFNQKVVMKATRTYLFQKIRELQLQGRRIFGIHIEIYSSYRTNDRHSPAFACQEALTAALAHSLQKAFQLRPSS